MSRTFYHPGTGEFSCEGCSHTWVLTLPCPISIVCAVAKQWGSDHRRCKSAKIAPRGKGGGKGKP